MMEFGIFPPPTARNPCPAQIKLCAPLKRTFFWSIGETTLAAKLAEAGRHTRAGMDVRMVELSADAGCGMGVWQKLYDFGSGAALSNHLCEASRTYCGTAGPAFLARLARERADNAPALMERFRKVREKFFEKHLPQGADGQVQSVAAFFALLGGAGELATEYDVLPWLKGEALHAAGARCHVISSPCIDFGGKSGKSGNSGKSFENTGLFPYHQISSGGKGW
jgi:hypothetical protein